MLLCPAEAFCNNKTSSTVAHATNHPPASVLEEETERNDTHATDKTTEMAKEKTVEGTTGDVAAATATVVTETTIAH